MHSWFVDESHQAMRIPHPIHSDIYTNIISHINYDRFYRQFAIKKTFTLLFKVEIAQKEEHYSNCSNEFFVQSNGSEFVYCHFWYDLDLKKDRVRFRLNGHSRINNTDCLVKGKKKKWRIKIFIMLEMRISWINKEYYIICFNPFLCFFFPLFQKNWNDEQLRVQGDSMPIAGSSLIPLHQSKLISLKLKYSTIKKRNFIISNKKKENEKTTTKIAKHKNVYRHHHHCHLPLFSIKTPPCQSLSINNTINDSRLNNRFWILFSLRLPPCRAFTVSAEPS